MLILFNISTNNGQIFGRNQFFIKKNLGIYKVADKNL